MPTTQERLDKLHREYVEAFNRYLEERNALDELVEQHKLDFLDNKGPWLGAIPALKQITEALLKARRIAEVASKTDYRTPVFETETGDADPVPEALIRIRLTHRVTGQSATRTCPRNNFEAIRLFAKQFDVTVERLF